jgi:hypothetical protein
MNDLDLDAILDRSALAYGKTLEQFPGSAPAAVREHFVTDVPALAAAIRQLTAELERDRRELGRLRRFVGRVGDPRGPLPAAETARRDQALKALTPEAKELVVDIMRQRFAKVAAEYRDLADWLAEHDTDTTNDEATGGTRGNS